MGLRKVLARVIKARLMELAGAPVAMVCLELSSARAGEGRKGKRKSEGGALRTGCAGKEGVCRDKPRGQGARGPCRRRRWRGNELGKNG